MKRLLSLLSVLLLSLSLLTACQNDASKGWKIVRGGWDFDVVRYEMGTVNNRVAVFEKNGKCGIVDFDGNIVVPATYTDLEISETTYGSGITKLFGNSDEEYATFEADGTKSSEISGGWGYEGFPSVYLYGEDIVIWNGMNGYLGKGYNTYKEYWYPQYGLLGTIAVELHPVVGVRKMTAYPAGDEEYPPMESELYALYDFEKETFLTGFEFEEVINVGVIENRIAVKKNGKWGYLDENGKAVTDFVYDTAEVGTDGRWRSSRMYAFTNGYAVVRQGDSFGLIDKDGNTIVEPTFQGVSQVRDDGLFFIKKNGKWWVAKLQ